MPQRAGFFGVCGFWGRAAIIGLLIGSGLISSAGTAIHAAEPGMQTASMDRKQALAAVQSWLLLLNNDLEPNMVSQIAASAHDLAVIDFLPSQDWAKAYDMAGTVRALKRKPDGGRRLVIAYLNVGQAEDYRAYFRKGWKPGKPSWILSLDPDGWPGNFPVAYWNSEWQSIIAGPAGLLDKIVAAGFDGIYMDWVSGFQDDAVMAAAKRDGVDPAAEMARWIARISLTAKAHAKDFLLIGQNAAPLLANQLYLDSIDAASHETIWFAWAGEGKNDPKGDCPVPASLAELSSKAYLDSLSPVCRRIRDSDPGSAMRFVGEANLVPSLQAAQAAGKAILTVDYALQPQNIQTVASKSRSLGFKPFVGEKDLKVFQPKMPE